MDQKKFNPLVFLMSLGAGGIAVLPFAFLQYTYPHGEGLIQLSQIGFSSLGAGSAAFFWGLVAVMAVFSLLHLALSAVLFRKLFSWKKQEYEALAADPLRNSALLAPFISIVMTMNVFIGPVRFFLPAFAENLQMLMAPALVFWALIWALLLWTVIKLLKTSFEKSFDVSKISFGWLLYPFALGMLTVTGAGIAAMAKDPGIAGVAAFMSIVSGSMGAFLLLVKMISIFKSHFASSGLPEKQFLPSFLIVVPNITLYAISAFRLAHYFEHNFAAHLSDFVMIGMVGAFAFETWYLLFGLALLSDYFRKHFFEKEFYVSQWGLVCPVVAYAVLGSFVYAVFVPSVVLYGAIVAVTGVAVALFGVLFARQLKCAGVVRGSVHCT